MADLSVDSSLSGESTTHSGRSRSSRSHHYSLLAYSLQAAVRANDLTPGEEQQIMECWIEVEVQLHLMILMWCEVHSVNSNWSHDDLMLFVLRTLRMHRQTQRRSSKNSSTRSLVRAVHLYWRRYAGAMRASSEYDVWPIYPSMNGWALHDEWMDHRSSWGA